MGPDRAHTMLLSSLSRPEQNLTNERKLAVVPLWQCVKEGRNNTYFLVSREIYNLGSIEFLAHVVVCVYTGQTGHTIAERAMEPQRQLGRTL